MHLRLFAGTCFVVLLGCADTVETALQASGSGAGAGAGGSSSQTSTTASATGPGGGATASTGVGAGTSTVSSSSVGGAAASSVVASSSSSGVGGGIPDCAMLGFNGIGAGCGPEGTTCRVPYACCGGTATCSGGVWTFDGVLCDEPCINCGNEGFGCAIGALCVVDQSFQTSFQCFANPCPSLPDCSCAASVCTQNFQTCVGTQNYTVMCDCPNCFRG